MIKNSFTVDYHIHTKWCEHAVGEMREYVVRAVELGLKEIGFAAHMPVMYQPHAKLALTDQEVEGYVSELARLRDEFAGKIKLRLGAEFDYRQEKLEEIAKYIAMYDFDYVYGSVHNIGAWFFDWDKYAEAGWRKLGVAEAYSTYFSLLAEAAASGLFDILSHFDLIKKFGQRPEGSILPLAAPALEAAGRAGLSVELNSSGWHFPCDELYPSPELLSELKTLGVSVTFGSDAHRPDCVGRDSVRALQAAKEAGYDHYAVFEGRVRRLVAFDETP
jgi:histidinol-phosphatase (PHP family)